MSEGSERYINPYTDFGFKKLFGTEMNKDLLISFLNALFNGHEVVRNVTYLNGEHFGDSYRDRKAIFDVYCENEQGEKFIVEMQKAEQDYFKDRSVYYATFPIREQAPRGDWDFQLKAVYTVGILNFVFPDDEYSPDCYHHEVKLMDTEDKHVFYDKLTFVYLEMPKFNKTEDELETMFDKWLFVLRNLSRLMDRPAALQERIFTKLFEQAEIARFTPQDAREYEESVKIYRDLTNVVNTAERKGRAEGRAEEKFDTARRMKSDGMPAELIEKYTGLSAEDIEKL
ncbi:MAG: Rpn family recombination-promoting nuclease/putative transposase [Bacteroidaceae bacterium]|nr:Rpn family recombination-promoting nuclease/putative transposase [Bacteroidaceae bacterium]